MVCLDLYRDCLTFTFYLRMVAGSIFDGVTKILH